MATEEAANGIPCMNQSPAPKAHDSKESLIDVRETINFDEGEGLNNTTILKNAEEEGM